MSIEGRPTKSWVAMLAKQTQSGDDMTVALPRLLPNE